MLGFEINNDNEEKEIGICIICPGHVAYELAHILMIPDHGIPLLAVQKSQLISEGENNHKIIIPKQDNNIGLSIAKALEKRNTSNEIIEIMTIGQGKNVFVERIMDDLNLDNKIQGNMIKLTKQAESYEYTFHLNLEENKQNTYKYAKKFYQRKQGNPNKTALGQSKGHIRKK